MSLIHPNSLADTVNAVQHAHFFNQPPLAGERRAAAHWIAARQGMEGAYAAFPATTPRDRRLGGHVFTGERFTNAACRHIFGEEACRALLLLEVKEKPVQAALDRAAERMLDILHGHERQPVTRFGDSVGCYCCGRCSVSLWRHLTAGGLAQEERRLAAGVATLKRHRDGTGEWRVFPFAYTVLALLEIDLPAAREELRYAAPRCERMVRQNRHRTVFEKRRLAVAERALAIT